MNAGPAAAIALDMVVDGTPFTSLDTNRCIRPKQSAFATRLGEQAFIMCSKWRQTNVI